MVDIAAIHNGSTNLPTRRTDSGDVITDASLRAVHTDCQQLVRDQVDHAIAAEDAGFDRVFFTEHHFQLVAAEFSTNPLQSQTYIAAKTDEIKLCQATNIITWHDPIRFAEQAAILDILSDGRAEIGIGRGYQPRENEVLGAEYWGGTIQDQEKNRKVFEEKWEIIKKAWTEDVFSHNGYFHHIPPNYTKWHHAQERAYLDDDVTEYDVDDVLDWKEGDLYARSGPNPVMSGGTTLKSLAVFPQPVQEPYPQIWQPVTSKRSCQWTAQNGVNAISFGDPSVEKKINYYFEAAEDAGWPDHRPDVDGEPFRYGWDEARSRGFAIGRWVFNTEVHDGETFERWKEGVEHTWHYFGPFGFSYAITGDVEELPSAEQMMDTNVIIAGDAETITDTIAGIAEDLGFEGFHFAAFFETSGVDHAVANEQLEAFGQDIRPYLEEEYPSPHAATADD